MALRKLQSTLQCKTGYTMIKDQRHHERLLKEHNKDKGRR